MVQAEFRYKPVSPLNRTKITIKYLDFFYANIQKLNGVSLAVQFSSLGAQGLATGDTSLIHQRKLAQ